MVSTSTFSYVSRRVVSVTARGLKPRNLGFKRSDVIVAPHAGAWIETRQEKHLPERGAVAPHAGRC
jgi:hypothetical protein